MDGHPEPDYRDTGGYHLKRLGQRIDEEGRRYARERRQELLNRLWRTAQITLVCLGMVGVVVAVHRRTNEADPPRQPSDPPERRPSESIILTCEGYVRFEDSTWTGRPCIRFPYAPGRDSGGECAIEYGIRLPPGPLPDASVHATNLHDAGP